MSTEHVLEALIDELARALHDPDEARELARRAGFSPADLPAFDTASVFWSRVVRAADVGKTIGGLGTILEQAKVRFPGNRFFAAYGFTTATASMQPKPSLRAAIDNRSANFGQQIVVRPLKHNTIANALELLRRMLNIAKRWGYVEKVPEIAALKLKGARLDSAQWLSEEETNALLDATEPEWLAVVTVAVRTGLRVGEVQGLRWGDVDLDGERLVQRSWSDHLQDVGPPKGGRPREVPFTWDAAAALRGLANLRNPKGYVFSSEAPFHANELRRALGRARRAAGIDKHLHAHMLRHTWASHCIMQGIASRVVMTWGGWTSEAMLDR